MTNWGHAVLKEQETVRQSDSRSGRSLLIGLRKSNLLLNLELAPEDGEESPGPCWHRGSRANLVHMTANRDTGVRLHFLGGADSIGASSTLVELGSSRLLVDCGIRMGSAGGDALPHLEPLREVGPPDAIILTHAHLDHSGGLPVAARNLPGIPVFCTPPTA
ncbi:MAG: MBL fold metallo-hydrolase, partial [Candidatus Eisenbacteria bacterium]|nr:MBL fold metallo-hydrolase [Candidatus Eisenbacteria bacterium]